MNFEEYKRKAFVADPALLDEYNALEPVYTVIKQLIQARIDNKMTQQQLADRLGINQSHISRLESGTYNPSLTFLKRVATGLGKELHIEFR
ncbi:helix-turn-helix transcriptional regulator [Deferribacterales bacterium RsTz2092]|nr:transcriptional regulator [Deferribacterales bacterium]